MTGKPNNGGSTADRSARERGAGVYGKTKTDVSDAYGKTSHAAGATHAQVKRYSSKNPGKKNCYRIRARRGSWISPGCKHTTHAREPDCNTRGQGVLQYCYELFSITGSVASIIKTKGRKLQ